jgi:UDPglucose 6-dehydrogenase
VAELYKPLGVPIQRVDIRTAEMIKYASNAFLATKISFINEMAEICEALGADVREVARGMGLDRRIGPQFLEAGIGWGGSCFPKDVKALTHMAAVHGAHPQLLRSVIEINSDQRLRVLKKLRSELGALEGRTVLILGAAFKGNTDDLRDSPALEIAALLNLDGVLVRIHDPIVPEDRVREAAPFAEAVGDPVAGSRGADAIILATNCEQFRELPLVEMRQVTKGDLLIDGRNFLDPAEVRRAGFRLRCFGRPMVEGNPPMVPASSAAGGGA